MKMLKIVQPDPEDKGETLLGVYLPSGDIYLNLEYMWNTTGSFNKFVKTLSKTWEHEVIHRLIAEELGRKKRTQVNEERIVRMLTHEQYRKWQKKFYKKEDERC